MWTELRFDRPLRAGLFVFALLVVPYLVPVLRLEPAWDLLWNHWTIPSLLVTLWFLQYQLAQIERREQRFWFLLIAGFSAWLVRSVLLLAIPEETFSVVAAYLLELLYFALFICFFAAVESRPDLPRGLRPGRLTPRLERVGLAFFAIALMVYFLILPLFTSSPEPLPRTLYLLITFDLFLALRTLQFALTSVSRRWQALFACLSCTAFLWLLTDGAQALFPVWQFDFDDNVPIAALWFLPFLPILAAARIRHFSFRERDGGESTNFLERLAAARSGPGFLLPVYSVALPILHFSLYLMGGLSDAERQSREVLVLATLAVLGTLALLQSLTLRREWDYLEEYRALFDQVADCIFIWRASDQRVLEANQQAADLLGLPFRQLSSKSLAQFSTQTAQDWRYIARAVEEHGMYLFEHTLIDSHGELRYLETAATPLQHGRDKAILSVSRDLTVTKQMEDALTSANEQLKVFLHVAAHQLRTPILTLSGFVAELRSSLSGPVDEPAADRAEVQEALLFIEQAAKDVASLSDAFRDFNRINDLQPEPVQLDLNDLVQEVLASLSLDHRPPDCEIRVQPLPSVIMDATLLRKAFECLFLFALQAIDGEAPGLVRVQAEEKHLEFQFRIWTSGCAVAREARDRAFHPLEVVLDGEGNLFFARALILRMRGRIWIESVTEEGTSITFTIPRRVMIGTS